MKKFLVFVLGFLMVTGLALSQDSGVQCHCPDKPDVSVKADCYEAVVSWSHNGNYVSEFNVTRNGNHVATVGKDVRSWTDNTVQEGYAYAYGVRAKNWYCRSNYDYVDVQIPTCQEPPKKVDCNIGELDEFDGYIVPYFNHDKNRDMYYVVLKWGIEGNRGSRDGEWQLMKSGYKIDWKKDKVEDAWYKQLNVINSAPYFDGRDTDFVFEDYNISKSKHYFYILRWKCGNCNDWEYYGVVHLIIPKK